ncbi:MAG: dethiobiotin synthase [Gammaproteobacteria bacterium]|nr:MAG: dethiobiotin synthase [Gammaproteobacteria bacterium]
MTKPFIVVTGTDTGVGKTLAACMLTCHLRAKGMNALACKPFASGGRRDIRLLQAVQPGCATDEEICPYGYELALAPWVAARLAHRRSPRLALVTRHLRDLSKRFYPVIIEGCGGLRAPLGEGYDLLDIVQKLDCAVVVVAANRLGTLNHTVLTVQAVQSQARKPAKVLLMGVRNPDISSRSNLLILRRLLKGCAVLEMPYLGLRPETAAALKKNCKKFEKALARLVE